MHWRAWSVGVGLAAMLSAHAGDLPQPALGVPEQVRVFRVLDGDRLLVRTRSTSQRVQLAGIDAPELDQPGGQGSRALLMQMIGGKRVVMRMVGENTVGEPLVQLQWKAHDIALDMVSAGAAWVSPDGGEALRAAEAEARADGLGIWDASLPPAIPPWQWRTEHGPGAE